MDVLEFRQRCAVADPALFRAITHAMSTIAGALHVFSGGRELVLSFNGGKDSTVVLHLLRAVIAERAAAAAAGAGAGAGPAAGEGALGAVRVVYFAGADARDFPEVSSFMGAAAATHGFAVERLPGFAAGLGALVAGGTRGVLMGTRAGDPDAATLSGAFSPTSPGWPPMMRVNPILGWTYADVWAFLRGARLPTCELYARGYTSLGSAEDSVPNAALRVDAGAGTDAECFRPAWELVDGSLERASRVRRAARGGAGAQQEVRAQHEGGAQS
jgi:FAD synthetase